MPEGGNASSLRAPILISLPTLSPYFLSLAFENTLCRPHFLSRPKAGFQQREHEHIRSPESRLSSGCLESTWGDPLK